MIEWIIGIMGYLTIGSMLSLLMIRDTTSVSESVKIIFFWGPMVTMLVMVGIMFAIVEGGEWLLSKILRSKPWS